MSRSAQRLPYAGHDFVWLMPIAALTYAAYSGRGRSAETTKHLRFTEPSGLTAPVQRTPTATLFQPDCFPTVLARERHQSTSDTMIQESFWRIPLLGS